MGKSLEAGGSQRFFREGKEADAMSAKRETWRGSWDQTVRATDGMETLSEGKRGEPSKDSEQSKQSIYVCK